jgi:hypothetical protein
MSRRELSPLSAMEMGDSLSPLEAFRVKRVFPQGSQTAEFVDLIIAVFVSL